MLERILVTIILISVFPNLETTGNHTDTDVNILADNEYSAFNPSSVNPTK